MNSRQEKFMEKYRARINRMTWPELKDEWERVRRGLNPNCKERQQEEVEEHSELKRAKYDKERVPKCSACEHCRPVMRPNATRWLFYCGHKHAMVYSHEHMKFGKTFICYGKPGGVKEPLTLGSPRWCPRTYGNAAKGGAGNGT